MTTQTSLLPAPSRWLPAALPVATSLPSRQLHVQWASCEEDVRQAQRLRHRVFAQELGAHLSAPAGSDAGLDADGFDPFCDHLLVKATPDGEDDGEDNADGLLVGTYRVLPPDAARRAGGLYIDTEFDISPLHSLRPRAVELGRSCVHPAWRTGGVILALWTALCQYMFRYRLETMIGCASVGLADGELGATRLWHSLQSTHLVDAQWRVQPRHAFPLHLEPGMAATHGLPPPATDARLPIAAPPLIKGYLRCGARLLGPPALDNAFNTADLPMMLRVHELAPRYRKHFIGA